MKQPVVAAKQRVAAVKQPIAAAKHPIAGAQPAPTSSNVKALIGKFQAFQAPVALKGGKN